MEELLKALQEANALPEVPYPEEGREATPQEEKIAGLANELFILSNGGINRAQMNEFERFAPCKIFCAERDSFGWLVGGIIYNGRKYYFG